MFSNPSFDLSVGFMLFGISIVIAILVLILTKKRLLSLVIFSVLGNLSFLINIITKSEMFMVYSVVWLEYFSLILWPVINIYLIIKLVKTKNAKK